MAKRVLVIDDEPIFLEMLEEWLVYCGYNVLTAAHGGEGLKKMEEQKPDIILLDLVMPVMDGKEFYSVIKSDERYRKIPVLIITGRPSPEEVIRPVHPDEFMKKPLDLKELNSKIGHFVSKK